MDAVNKDDIILCSRIKKNNSQDGYFKIFKITNSGNKIEEIYSIKNQDNHSWHSVSHPSQDVIIVVGDSVKYINFASYKHYPQILISKDGGQNWQTIKFDSNYSLIDISMYDENFGVIITHYKGADETMKDSLLITNDCWQTYTKIYIPDDLICYKVFCHSKNKFSFHCRDINKSKDLFLVTDDCGKSWNFFHYFDKNTYLYDLDYVDSTIYAIGDAEFVPGVSRKSLFRSDDFGKNWTNITTMYNDEYFINFNSQAIDFFDKDNGIIGNYYNTILITTDGGES